MDVKRKKVRAEKNKIGLAFVSPSFFQPARTFSLLYYVLVRFAVSRSSFYGGFNVHEYLQE